MESMANKLHMPELPCEADQYVATLLIVVQEGKYRRHPNPRRGRRSNISVAGEVGGLSLEGKSHIYELLKWKPEVCQVPQAYQE